MFEGKEWFPQPGASPQVLADLKRAVPVALPQRYYDLLAFSDGGEGALPVQPFNLCLDSAQEVIGWLGEDDDYHNEFAGFLIFGGNGGGEYIAFDLRAGPPFPIVFIDKIAGAETAEIIAPDFNSFFELIGIEE